MVATEDRYDREQWGILPGRDHPTGKCDEETIGMLLYRKGRLEFAADLHSNALGR